MTFGREQESRPSCWCPPVLLTQLNQQHQPLTSGQRPSTTSVVGMERSQVTNGHTALRIFLWTFFSRVWQLIYSQWLIRCLISSGVPHVEQFMLYVIMYLILIIVSGCSGTGRGHNGWREAVGRSKSPECVTQIQWSERRPGTRDWWRQLSPDCINAQALVTGWGDMLRGTAPQAAFPPDRYWRVA